MENPQRKNHTDVFTLTKGVKCVKLSVGGFRKVLFGHLSFSCHMQWFLNFAAHSKRRIRNMSNYLLSVLPACLPACLPGWLAVSSHVATREQGKGNFVPVHTMKAYVDIKIYLHSFLTSVLAGGEQSALHLGRFNPHGM
jgi:hypothetical protein